MLQIPTPATMLSNESEASSIVCGMRGYAEQHATPYPGAQVDVLPQPGYGNPGEHECPKSGAATAGIPWRAPSIVCAALHVA